MKEDRYLDNVLNEFYAGYVEDERLNQDKMHQLEYITTKNYIDKYLKAGDRILEVGAGTGMYSLYYASKGYQVDAVELVKTNLDVFKANIKSGMNINAIQGNALDLSMYEDNTFDMTLVLGPLYHLFKPEEIKQAINEAIRVTKPGGIIYIAFILFDLTMLTWGFIEGNLVNNIGEGKMVDNNYRPINDEKLIFNIMYIDEVKKVMDSTPLTKLNIVAADGVGRVLKDTLNGFDEETYKHYINYHLSTCEREDLIGFSGHILYVGRK